MINIQGHTSVGSQTMYSGLEPGTVRHKTTVYYNRFAGLILTLPTSATSQGARCHELALLHISRVAA